MILAYGGYGYYGFDPLWLLLMLSGVVALIAQFKVSSTFNKYNNVRSMSGYTGAEAAQRILMSKGITDVPVRMIPGNLTDNYDPVNRVLNLSEATYNSCSVAAVGVAAHECGHAVQHNEGYAFLNLRNAIFPVANFGSRFSFILIVAGLFFGSFSFLVDIGIILFSFAVLFQVVTLPVEFDASARALKLLEANGILYNDEIKKTRKVLSAAAMTYVAAAATAVLQLARLLLLRGRNRD